MDTVLEVLYATRESLEDSIPGDVFSHQSGMGTAPYDFSEWSACTCGHIYAAALGKPVTEVIELNGHLEHGVTMVPGIEAGRYGPENHEIVTEVKAAVDAHERRLYVGALEAVYRANRGRVGDPELEVIREHSDAVLHLSVSDLTEQVAGVEHGAGEDASDATLLDAARLMIDRAIDMVEREQYADMQEVASADARVAELEAVCVGV